MSLFLFENTSEIFLVFSSDIIFSKIAQKNQQKILSSFTFALEVILLDIAHTNDQVATEGFSSFSIVFKKHYILNFI